MDNEYYWEMIAINQRRLTHGVDGAQFAGEQYDWAMQMYEQTGDEFYLQHARNWATSLHNSLETIDHANFNLNQFEEEIGY